MCYGRISLRTEEWTVSRWSIGSFYKPGQDIAGITLSQWQAPLAASFLHLHPASFPRPASIDIILLDLDTSRW